MGGTTTLNSTVTIGMSVTFDGGANRLTNIGTPTASIDAATKGYVDGVNIQKYTATTTTTVSGTVNENTLIGSGVGSLTISANTLTAGSIIRVYFSGGLNSGGQTTSSTFKLKLGSTVLGQANLSGSINNNVVYHGVFDIVARSVGTGGTFITQGSILRTDSSNADAAIKGTQINNTTTIDTTINQTLDFTVTKSSIGDPTVTCGTFNVVIIKA